MTYLFFLLIQNESNMSLILVTQNIPNAHKNAKTLTFQNVFFS